MYIHPVQIIIFLVAALVLLAARMAYSSRRLASEPKVGGAEDFREVKGRVEVLERIVTDKEHSLSREIEQLRGR